MGLFESTVATFLAPVKEYLDDETVTEILVNGPTEIWVERKGKLVRTEASFGDEVSLQGAARNIAQFVGRNIDDDSPQLDARLPDGSRIHIVIPPSARNGTTMSIRKFAKGSDINIEKLVEIGSLSAVAAKFLGICVHMGKNVLVSGGTGSGKTTLLNVLGAVIPNGTRVMIIEDSSELKFQSDHVVYFETKAANDKGLGALGIRDLVKSAMRLRPDRVIVGEVRGPEALDLITVMNTGHAGSMGTTHANTPMDALVRVETLSMMGDTTIPIAALRRQISAAIEVVVQAKRFADGSRKISHISEVMGVDEHGRYEVNDLFRFEQKGRSKDGKVLGQMEACGILPSFMHDIEINGYNFPRKLFAKPQKKQVQRAPAAGQGQAPAQSGAAAGQASATAAEAQKKPSDAA